MRRVSYEPFKTSGAGLIASTVALPEISHAEHLYRHYSGLPGWRAHDRKVLAKPARAPARPEAVSAGVANADEEVVKEADAKAAAHEEEQLRAANEAVVRDAREVRMP